MPELRLLLRDLQTGAEAVHVEDISAEAAEDPDDNAGFYWTDGNGACDCNRARVLYTALNQPTPDVPCGDTRIVIVEAQVGGQPKRWEDAPHGFR